MTPLTPPRGVAVSPFLRGIKWTWQWNTVWPLTSPALVPILNCSTRYLKQQPAVFTRVRVGRYWVQELLIKWVLFILLNAVFSLLSSKNIKLKKKWYKWQVGHNPLKRPVLTEPQSATSSQLKWQTSGDTRLACHISHVSHQIPNFLLSRSTLPNQ